MKKYLNNSLPLNISHILTPNSEIHDHFTRQYTLPHKGNHKSSLALRSIFHTTTHHYSKIPNDIKHIKNEMQFRKALKCQIVNDYWFQQTFLVIDIWTHCNFIYLKMYTLSMCECTRMYSDKLCECDNLAYFISSVRAKLSVSLYTCYLNHHIFNTL